MYIGGAKGRVCVPANRLADSYEEILSLLSDWREGFQDNMSVLRTNPDGSSRVVGLQVKPRKIALFEDVRDQLVLLFPMSNHRVLVSILLSLKELASQSAEFNRCGFRHELRSWGRRRRILNIYIFDVPFN